MAHGSRDLQWVCSLVPLPSHWCGLEWREGVWLIYSSTLLKKLCLWWLGFKGRIREDAPLLTIYCCDPLLLAASHLPWLSSVFSKGSRVSSSASSFLEVGYIGRGEDAVKPSSAQLSEMEFVSMSSHLAFPIPSAPGLLPLASLHPVISSHQSAFYLQFCFPLLM